jgi:heat shock protein HslJ
MKILSKICLLAIGLLMLAACQPEYLPADAVPELAGTDWLLSSLDGSLPLSGTTLTLQFGDDGTVSGTDGCNRFSGSFTQEGDSLTMGPPLAGTMMACPEPIMNQAAAYTDALGATTSFNATGNQLTLLDGDEILATFVADSQDLADTAWQVTAYNNGRQAVVSPILGTDISANFDADGQVTGNAGCNEYFASYTIDGDTLSIGPVGTTFRLCDSPPGVMEQESEYLAALATAATYEVEGNQLTLRTADGAIAVQMTRKLAVDLTPPPPATPLGRVTAPQGVNVRAGPGTNYPVIAFAQFGDEGEIIGRSADRRWWAASIPSAPDGIGWVSADFVAAVNAEDVPVIEPAPPVVVPPIAATPPATPTPVPPPTATPVPELSLSADPTTIDAGQCATLTWSVEHVQAVWVYPRGEAYERFPRAGQGSEEVCPTSTTTYEMRVLLRDGTTVLQEVTVTVNPGPTPTATAVPPTATPVPPTPTEAPATDPLAGTRWEVVQYNNFSGGIVTLIADTRITTEFGADGQVTGNAGCNNYFGPYQVNGDAITIGMLGASSRFCAEPEGVMEQEAEFLEALQAAATFRVDGDTLELRTAEDQIAVILQRAQ